MDRPDGGKITGQRFGLHEISLDRHYAEVCPNKLLLSSGGRIIFHVAKKLILTVLNQFFDNVIHDNKINPYNKIRGIK